MPKGVRGLFRRASTTPPSGPRSSASVVLVAQAEARGAQRTLHRLIDARDPSSPVEVVVVANACPPATLTRLEEFRDRLPELVLVRTDRKLDRAAALMLAVERAQGHLVVSLTAGVEVLAGWLPPLTAAFDDSEVLGVSPVLRSLDGTVASAGPAFPPVGAPYPFLAGFPIEDAGFLADHALAAVNGPAVAFRRTAVLAAGGLRQEVGEALWWADLSLRLVAARPGRFLTCPTSSVVVRNPATPSSEQRAAFLAHWPQVPDNEGELWARAGFDVIAHDADSGPALRRRPAPAGVPRLRWAIKNPATALGRGEQWGDTHFCRRLAEALRRLGQTVAVDHREAFDRETGRFDDVTLVVRGLTPHTPTPGAVNLAWLISHPELMDRVEAAGYDRLFAAGPAWAEQKAREWKVRIDPLLQATDPALFHPDRATPDSGPRVLFVGSARDGQREIVRQAVAAGLPVTVHGPGWAGHLPPEQVAGDYLANAELGAAYRAAGIVLNDHWAQMRAGGFLSNRLFDAAASGARVVTDDVEFPAGLESLFGRSVQVARTAEDLTRLAADLAIFGDDTERRAVAARVRAEHSFDARARVLLDAALELHARSPEPD